MEQEPRKATDVLLDLELKVGLLLDIIRSQDLNIKILSNKLNDVINRLDKQQTAPPKVVVEAVHTPSPMVQVMPIPSGDPSKNIPIYSEESLPQEIAPKGFRRNSRPETFAGDNAFLPKPSENKMPMQMPKAPSGRDFGVPPPGRMPTPDPVITAPPMHKGGNKIDSPLTEALPTEHIAKAPLTGQIPIMQRCVDKNGKSIFLADVEIMDKNSGQPVFKTRTNGTGKWMATLSIGEYQVTVKKRLSLSKDQIEAKQEIQVDGTQSPLELPMMIIR